MIPEIDQTSFAARLVEDDVLVVDVRESREYRPGHVPGAKNVPLSVLPALLPEVPKDRPVYVICQSGGRSAQPRADAGGRHRRHHRRRRNRRVDRGRSPRRDRRLIPHPERTPMITVLPLDTPGLGDRTYLAHDGEVALVVDPQRDYDRVLGIAEAAGVRITHVFESHIHNDYVTGGLELAREVGAQYLLNADDPVSFERTGVSDGDVVEVGARMRCRSCSPRAHPHPPVLRARGRRRVGGGLHRRLAAVRLHRAPRPARPRPHPGPGPRTVALRPALGRGAARRDRRLPDARLRELLLGHPVRRHGEHHRSGEARQPGAHDRRVALRRGPPRRPGRLPGVLRAHGHGQLHRPRRGRPLPPTEARPGRAAPAHRGRRVGRRPAQPHRLRRQGTSAARSTSASTGSSSPTSPG